jgi:putative intracellular protease/amidase/rhodanese-related sulfurtransferase
VFVLKIGIILFSDVEELDFAGPYEVFSYIQKVGREAEVFTVSEDGMPLRCANGLKVEPDYDFARAPQPDWLLIPGGQGRRREMHNPAMLRYVQDVAATAEVVASVCTGAFILAAAGLIRQGPATTYHLALEELRQFAPGLTVTGSRVEQQGHIYMAAGVSAGIDLALELCDRLEPGLGRRVAEKIEYHPAYSPPQVSGVTPVMGQMCVGLEQFLQYAPRDLGGIDSAGLRERLQSANAPLIVDVREAEEVKSGMIEGAMHIPLRSLPSFADRLPQDRETEIVTVCRSGHRSAYAALYLRALGYRNVLNLEYGMLGWQSQK